MCDIHQFMYLRNCYKSYKNKSQKKIINSNLRKLFKITSTKNRLPYSGPLETKQTIRRKQVPFGETNPV